jgi:hypothetical protein
MTGALLVALAAVVANCGSRVCAPGQSVLCNGPGGCLGGQVCNADGTAFGVCDCGSTGGGAGGGGGTGGGTGGGGVGGGTGGGADGGTDGGSGGDGGSGPTEGALRTVWTLQTSAFVKTCAEAGATGISVVFTLQGTSTAFNRTFNCPAASSTGTADAINIPFGTYTVVVSATDSANQAVGSAPEEVLTFDATNCAPLLQGDCGRTIAPVVPIP